VVTWPDFRSEISAKAEGVGEDIRRNSFEGHRPCAG
jgi:hypothetical protein